MIDGLDRIDVRLLEELQVDGRATATELAERVGLSPSACHRRVRRLEADGVIAGYVMLVDPVRIGRGLDVFVEVSLDSQADERLAEFEAAVVEVPEVMSVHLVAGDADYLLHLAVADTSDFARIHSGWLARLPGVTRIRSNFAMRAVYSTTAHHLD